MDQIAIRKNQTIIVVFLAIIISISIYASFEIRASSIPYIYFSTLDDAAHISLANNWANGIPFQFSMTPIRFVYTTNELVNRFESAPHDSPWPPLFHILFAGLINSFLLLLAAETINLYLPDFRLV